MLSVELSTEPQNILHNSFFMGGVVIIMKNKLGI